MRRLLTLPRLALFTVLLAGGILALGHLAGFAQNAQTDRGIVADLISKALSSDTSQVSIGEVNGALSSDVEIRDIVLSDRDGAWLRLDRLRLVWTRSALLLRRLDVDRLEIGKLEILRRPAPQPTGTAPPSDGPILPELPLKVILRAFQLNELVLGEPVIGVAARLGATGAARLGPPNEGLDLKFEARRLDMGGTFNVDLSFVPESTRLRLAAKLDEPAGGLISKAAGLPGEPPVKLDLNGDGPLDSFRSNLTFTAGPTIGAEGSATVDRTGSERQLALALDARIEGLMPAPAAPVFAGSTKLDGTVGFADDGGIDIRNLALVSALARLDVLGRYNPDKTLDLHVTAASRPNAGGRTVASGTEIGKLAFDATIRGPVAGPTVAARLDAQDARLPIGQFGKVGLTFNATPSGSIGDAETRIVLTSDGEATGIALADKALARAVGDKVTFTLRGTGNDDATADFETLRLALAGMELDYNGKLGQAGRSMEGAARQLGEGQPGGAVGQQGEALQALREGARGMAERMARENGTGTRQGANGTMPGQDPLGREREQNGRGTDLGSSVKVPDAIDAQRAREILDAIRRRLGDAARPLLERDYLERLLQPY